MSDPVFSVILVNWNTASLLVEAVSSAFDDAERSGIPIEVVVVDNGSTDDSVNRIRKEFPRAGVIENGRNLGFSRAVNRGLSVASGSHIILLNTDARLVPGALSVFRQTLEENPRVGIIGGMLLDPDGSPQNSYAPFPTLATEVLNKSLLRLLFPGRYARKPDPHATALLPVDSIVGACFVIRRETVNDVGPLDERFFFFFEETDWCYQARTKGWEVVVNPQVRITHGQGESSKPVLVKSRIEFYRSRYRYFFKNCGVFQTGLLFAGLLIKNVVETVFAGFLCVVTLGRSAHWRRRFRVVASLLLWHLLGCPKSWGLEGALLGATPPKG